MPFLDRNILRDLQVVHSLEDRESLSDRVDADVFQGGMVEMNEDVSGDPMFCESVSNARVSSLSSAFERTLSDLPCSWSW